MADIVMYGARITIACVTSLFPVTTTVWVWSVERTGTVLMEWMSTCAPVTAASQEGGVRSTLMNARESTAVVMADALMEWTLSTVNVTLAMLVHSVRLLLQTQI